ncbi:SDR family NAD(P)-dependent oxidoreductase [Chryseobacterium sp. TY3]
MQSQVTKSVLILGANSDVAKQAMKLYLQKGFDVMAASRDLTSIEKFIGENNLDSTKIQLLYFDAADFSSHQEFYKQLPKKPTIVVYAAGFLVQNEKAFHDFDSTFRMMKVNYAGAVSILNIIAFDFTNKNLQRIIGLSSLSGVRGRKSNFVYGSTKSAFTQYLAGLRQELSQRNIKVNALVIGYINTKINEGLALNKNLIMQPQYVAKYIIEAGSNFKIVPNWKWKIIHLILKWSPEFLVSKLP